MNKKKVIGLLLVFIFCLVSYVWGAQLNVEKTIKDLKDKDPKIRRGAAVGLEYVKDPRVIGLLITALGDENWEVRQAVVNALGRTKDPRAVPPLIAALKDSNSRVRFAAAWHLGKFKDPKAVEPLITCLNDEDLSVARNAAESLGKIGDPRAAKPLGLVLGRLRKAAWALAQLGEPGKKELGKALKNKDSEVRSHAISRLGKGDEWAIPSLITVLLKDKDRYNKSDARMALVRIGTPAVNPLIKVIHKDAAHGCLVAETLGDIKDPRAIAPLIKILDYEDLRDFNRVSLALGKMGAPAVEPLVTALKTANPRVKSEAASALLQIRDKAAVEPLTVALKDEDVRVRRIVAFTLVKIKDPKAVEPLIIALKDEDGNVREDAAWALGKIKDPKAIRPLIIALKDEDWHVQYRAKGALRAIGTPAVEPLITALKNEDSRIRRGAAFTLGRIKNPEVVKPLIIALKDEDWDVREGAAWALGKIKDPQALEPLTVTLKDNNYKVRKESALALGNMGKEAIPYLMPFLEDEEANIRRVAAQALGMIKDPESILSLITLLGDEGPYVRRAASQSLVKIGSSAVPSLIEALKSSDQNVQLGAIISLGETKDKRVVAPLIEILRSKDTELSVASANALGRLGSPAISSLLLLLEDNDPKLRRAAARALRWTKNNKAKEALREALARKDYPVIIGACWFYINNIEEGDEEVLIDVFNKYPDKESAESFFYSGNPKLKEIGKKWLRTHGYGYIIDEEP